MNNFQRKIGPKLGEKNNLILNNEFKPRLYEDQINFDQMRMYRLNRVKKQLIKNDIGACILFDPINIRYATDTRNMSMYTMHIISRYVFIPAEGPVILFEYPKSEHLAEGICTVDEIRDCIVWDFFSNGNNVYDKALQWAASVDDLMKHYVSENNNLAIDTLDPAGISSLKDNYKYNLVNAQKFLETARSIKSKDELICMEASLRNAEKGIHIMHEKLEANMTEEELWSYLHKSNIETGGEWFDTRLLSSGPRTNPWLQECSNRIIQKGELHDLAYENIKHNEQLIKPGMTFREFAEKAWKLPENYYDNHYPCQVHGLGMCDEWPFIAFPNKDYSNSDFSGIFEENMMICVESYIGDVGGREGVKLEDQYVVTANGFRLMSKIPLNLI